MWRTVLVVVVIVVLVGAGLFFVYQRRQAAAESEFEIVRQAEVARDQIAATVNATGTIEPEALVTLTFGMAGTIQDVNAARGELVQAGQVLASLDTAELLLAVQQAQDALRVQELTLAQRQASEPTAATLASAQADIDSAQASVAVAEANQAAAEAAVLQAQAQRAQIVAGPTAGDKAAAQAQLASAQAAQKSAQITYDRILECFDFEIPTGEDRTRTICPGLGIPEETARFNLNDANMAVSAAEAQLSDLDSGPRPADVQAANAAIANAQASVQAAEGNVAVAEANLARAQAAYDRLLEPAPAEDLAILQAQVASASTNLDLAQLRLEQAQIKAPIDGRVANVLINEGEQATPGAPAISIVNEQAFHLDVSVDEIDIEAIALDQAVDITLDALPDRRIRGSIGEIAPTAGSTAGVVTYLVTINIEEEEDVDLRPGMTANADIVVSELDDVLVVPNWAIRLDRETGDAFVNVLQPDGSIAEVVVETGLRNEQFSQVLSGLESGSIVVVTNQREGLNFFGG
jgi:HlyD family secretion protein